MRVRESWEPSGNPRLTLRRGCGRRVLGGRLSQTERSSAQPDECSAGEVAVPQAPPPILMTSSSWARHMSWRHAPEQYGAIHFHDDDLYDAGWVYG